MQHLAVACGSTPALLGRAAAAGGGAQRQRRAAVLVAADKGFSGGQGQPKPKQVKVRRVGGLEARLHPCRMALHPWCHSFQLLPCFAWLECLTAHATCAHTPSPTQKSKRGKVASRPDLRLQMQQQQEAEEERQRLLGAQRPGAAQEEDDDDTADDVYMGSSSRNVEYGSTAAVPEAVTNRMLKRVRRRTGAWFGPLEPLD